MEEWKEYKLGDCVEMQKGFAFKSSDYINNGIKIIKVSNLNQKRFDDDSCVFISPDLADQYSRYSIKEDDIIISTVGSWPTNPESVVGKVCRVQKIINGSLLNQNAVRLRVKNNFNQRFIYYILSSSHFSSFIANTAQGSANQASITLDDIKSYVFNSPSFLDQDRIANFLKSLDDKIEVNRRINENLEQQAQALFKSWFVDFEPFKDGEFVESELGMIPKGWRVGKLSDVANITMGTSPAGTSYNVTGDGDVFYQGRAEFGFRFPKRNMFTTEAKRFAEIDSVLLSVRAPVGDINVAEERCCIGRGLASILSNEGNNSFVLYLMQNLKPSFDQFNGEGTVFGSINKKALEELAVIIPPKEIRKGFDTISNTIDSEIKNLEQESRRLAELRDTLLPRLMSGEIKLDVITL